MMDIDWSKAPAWASAVGTVSGGSPAWISDKGYCFQGIANPPCHPHKAENYTRDSFTIVARRPWTGEGLPPVGLKVEALIVGNGHATPGNNEWCQLTLKYKSVDFSVFERADGEEFPLWNPQYSKFRPIRSAEQIAAEERQQELESALRAIDSILRFPPNSASGNIVGATVRAMLEAGYCKQEQK